VPSSPPAVRAGTLQPVPAANTINSRLANRRGHPRLTKSCGLGCCGGLLCQPQQFFGILNEATKLCDDGRALVLIDSLLDILIDGERSASGHAFRIAHGGGEETGAEGVPK
jgi:hypothetical protein